MSGYLLTPGETEEVIKWGRIVLDEYGDDNPTILSLISRLEEALTKRDGES